MSRFNYLRYQAGVSTEDPREREVSLPANQNVTISQPGVNCFAHGSLGFLLSALWIFTLCLCDLVISNRSSPSPARCLKKSSPFIFSERQPLSLQLRESCALLGSLSLRKQLQRESQGGDRFILLDLFLRDQCCPMSENGGLVYFVLFSSLFIFLNIFLY